MSLHLFTLDQKLALLESEVDRARKARRAPRSDAAVRYHLLKAIAADVRARLEFPRSNALGDLSRAIEAMDRSKTALGFDAGQMAHVAQTLINKWPTVSQALEQFGEESAE